MSFNKILFPILIITQLSLNNCKSNKKEIINIRENAKEIIIKKSNRLEKKASLDSSEIPLETIRNNEYLLTNIQNKPHLQDEEYLKEKINKFMGSLEHTYVKKDTNNTIFYNTSELTLGQLQRIYLMYEYLGNPSSVQEVGKMIEEDIADKYAEHGGIILFNKKNIYFKTLESSLKKDTLNNERYKFRDEVDSIPNLGNFHLHSTSYNEKESAHPSSRDLIISYYTTDLNNESHEFLITPIKKGTFNIDYYGGDKFKNPVIKVLDLGNYTYDTTKIK